ncbi:DNA mismatch repair endonuclease MutL [Candidatus Sumerlaeota bacterium]|nr:DNA mismatch repair endonuclease MutL [Candidatus Sumerlaeota bacterium]
MPVRILPQTLINQIAAGEVVVRMASVVKELVENSIDAGATRIEIKVGNEARDLDVRDDGCGMSRDDAELSLQRHATSKIQTVEDLFSLATRGFRGEALPSIASVSRMEMHTRQKDSLSGTRIIIEGGRIQRIESFGCPTGTRIIIRDLFFNTPARHKFLKSTISEVNALLATVTRQAIAQPLIGFRVERDDREVFELPPGQNLVDRFASILGSHLKGKLLPVDFERDGTRVQGVLAHPHDARNDRRSQYFYVNERPFSSKSLTAALEQACRGFVMIGKFPMGALFVGIAPGDVDFNVHPTKEEVRFRDERHVAGTVFHAVRAALEGSEALVGSVEFREEEKHESPERNPADAEPTPPQGARANVLPGFFTSPEQLVRRAFERKKDRPHQTDWMQEAQRFHAAPQRSSQPVGRRMAMRHEDGSTISAGAGELPDEAFWSTRYEPEPLGQIAATYMLVRHGPDLLIVDQHAAHERIVYLSLQRRAAEANTQPLLIPVTFDLEPAESEALRDLRGDLARLGFEVEEFGARNWVLQSLPADLPEFDPVPMIRDLISDFEESRRARALEEMREKILIRTACHSAIRAGMQLTQAMMQELLNQIRAERLSLTCPHGRPTIVRLGRDELEKYFKRVV